MTEAQLAAWTVKAQVTIGALWLARHTDPAARDRIRFWVRVLHGLRGTKRWD